MSEVLDNILAKYRAFGFDPPLHPDKYLVPISINEFTEVVNGVHQLKCQLAEAKKVIQFYADEENWSKHGECKFTEEDIEDYTQVREFLDIDYDGNPVYGEELELVAQIGGKLAREYFKNKKDRHE